MGIQGLTHFLNQNNWLNLKIKINTKHTRWSVDSSIILYQTRCSKKYADVYPDYIHLYGFVDYISMFLNNKIDTIWVFDGRPPPEKKTVIQQRKRKKDKLKEDILKLELENREENEAIILSQKKQLKSVHVPSYCKYDIQELLTIIGTPYLNCGGEAEAYCVQMEKDGLCNAIYTADSDVLVFGCKNMVKKLFYDGKYEIFNQHNVVDNLKLTYPQFIDFCILCGGDYCEHIPNMTLQTALRIIKTHGSIENSLYHLQEKYNVPEDYLEQANRARELYTKQYDISGIVFPSRDPLNIYKMSHSLMTFFHCKKGINISESEKLTKTLLNSLKQFYSFQFYEK